MESGKCTISGAGEKKSMNTTYIFYCMNMLGIPPIITVLSVVYLSVILFFSISKKESAEGENGGYRSAET